MCAGLLAVTFLYFSNSVLPIVMGARPEDYARAAPHHSYIHVDQFRGPRELAEYLLLLDREEEKYNKYFQVTFL